MAEKPAILEGKNNQKNQQTSSNLGKCKNSVEFSLLRSSKVVYMLSKILLLALVSQDLSKAEKKNNCSNKLSELTKNGPR